jgi:hypothetical protein
MELCCCSVLPGQEKAYLISTIPLATDPSFSNKKFQPASGLRGGLEHKIRQILTDLVQSYLTDQIGEAMFIFSHKRENKTLGAMILMELS